MTPGVLTTIQDLGREGYGQYGIPVSGAMDRFSFKAANMLVGNDPGAAGLEITLYRLKLEVLRTVHIAVTGGDMNPVLDGESIPMWQTIKLPAGSTLLFKDIRNGARAYLAVEGGIDSAVMLGSRSTCRKALLGKALGKGDVVRVFPEKRTFRLQRVPEAYIPHISKEREIRVVMGPQEDHFTKQGIDTFLGNPYTITSQSDRQGYRLQGPQIEHLSGADIISDAILPGSIQVPGNGQPIVMMMDAQTTGGYTKIATVISADLNILAQMLPGRRLRFRKITIQEAHSIFRNEAARWRRLEEELILL
ncbi:MAG: biotin-dependent carboxyltransferase family protein [Deltaproteobacteria bacterium]|nr:biotin-dependent carboxyltransferase family protein [Deltaproteobacteria bacterium]MBW2153049.1 biotin-dependent carboxyltransferase family protein [Deltaproteobacteria bacterium]